MESSQRGKKINDNLYLFLILGLAALFRLVLLDIKPPHFDEGINGWFTDQLITRGYYKYDPTNYHGPLHFYILLVFKFLFGRNLWALRLPTVLFGVASVYLITHFKKYIGRVAAYSAALFLAVSPGMIFYSRYSIHEAELLFFSILFILGFFRYFEEKDKTSLWFMSLGLSGMILTKETFIIHIGTLGIAWLCLSLYEKYVPSEDSLLQVRKKFSNYDALLIWGVGAFLVLIFYSGFFLSWQGVEDLFKSFMPWFKTGEKGNGHEKPFNYWLKLMLQYEWVSLAGVILVLRFLLPSHRWMRFLAIYGFGVLLAYSLIPYKTPWCVIQILWPFMLIVGFCIQDLFKPNILFLWIAVSLLSALAVPQAVKSYELNFIKYSHDKEPYVYVQTYPEIMNVMAKLKKLTDKDPSFFHQKITIVVNSDWPLPWLLGDFTKVGYYGSQLPPDPESVLLIVDADRRAAIESKLKNKYITETFTLRSSKNESVVFYDAQVFKDFFQGKGH